MKKAITSIIAVILLVILLLSAASSLYYFINMNKAYVETETASKKLSMLSSSNIDILSEEYSLNSISVDIQNSGRSSMSLDESTIALVIKSDKNEPICPVNTLDSGGAFEANIAPDILGPSQMLRITISIDPTICSLSSAREYEYQLIFQDGITSKGKFQSISGGSSGGTSNIFVWESPTPDDGSSTNNNYVYLNTTVNDPENNSAFYDWDNSLVGYWSFEYTDNSYVYDNSSYINNGEFTCYDSCSPPDSSNIVQGKYGNAINLDGTDDYVNISDSSSLDITGDMSVEVWIKPDAVGDSHHKILSKRIDSDYTTPYQMTLHQNGNATFLLGGGSGSRFSAETSIGLIQSGNWYHIVGTVEGTTINIYVNGNLEGTEIFSGTRQENDAPVKIGVYPDTGTPYNPRYFFDGLIDEVKLYNRTLSSEEINASYNNDIHRLQTNISELQDGTYNYLAYSINSNGTLYKSSERTVEIDTSSGSPTGVFTFQIDTNLGDGTNTFEFQTDDAVNLFVDWGDGTNNTYSGTALRSHTYSSSGIYDISLNGELSRLSFYEGTEDKLIDVLTNVSDGLTGITSAKNMFKSTFNFGVNPLTEPTFFDDVSSNIINMENMFEWSHFNQPLNSWDTSSVMNMESMFADTLFNQDISSWDVSSVTGMLNMLDNTSLSVENYDALLIGWESLPSLQSGVTLGASGLYYCNGEAARQTLIDTYGWTFNGDSKNCCGMSITEDTFLNEDFTGCTGTIFYMASSNITLDCQGHYLESSGSYGIRINNQNNVTIKNCIINLTGSSSSYGINLDNADNCLIYNNSVSMWGEYDAIRLTSESEFNNISNNDLYSDHYYALLLTGNSGNNIIINNNLTSKDRYALRIVNGAHGNTVTNNNVTCYGDTALFLTTNYNEFYNNDFFANTNIGVWVSSGNDNIFEGGNIDSGNQDYRVGNSIVNVEKSCYFRNTGFSTQKIGFNSDDTSWFNYNNDSSGGIWLNTSAKAVYTGYYITRTLDTLTQDLVEWTDTSSDLFNVTYYVDNLVVGEEYNISMNGVELSVQNATNGYVNFSVNADGTHNFDVARIS